MTPAPNPLIPLAQLFCVLGKVEGRKKLQKIVHILRECGAPFGQRFEYSFYGMYSEELRGETAALVDEDLLSERDGTPFIYESTEKLRALLAQNEIDAEPRWGEIARDLNCLSAGQLEGISTVLYLRRVGFSGTELRERLLELKPHLSNCVEFCEQKASSLPTLR